MKLLLLFWQTTWKLLTRLIILLAVLAAIGKLLLPQVAHWKTETEHWLSARLGQEVRIGRLRGDWKGMGPRLHLENLRLLNPDDEPTLAIRRVEVVLNLASLFTSKSRVLQFVFRQATVELRRQEDGRLQMSMEGLARTTQPGASGDNLLTRLGSLRLVDSRLILHWSDDEFPLVFEQVNLLYTRSARKIWAGGFLVPLGEHTPMEFRLRHQIAQQTTDLYLTTEHLDLKPWATPLLSRWTHLRSGQLSLQLWARLNGKILDEAWGDFRLENLGLESPQPLQINTGQQITPRYWRKRLGAQLHYYRQSDIHDLSILDFYSEGSNQLEQHGRGRLRWSRKTIQLAVEQLQLGRLDQLLRATAAAQLMEKWLPYETSPTGQLLLARANFSRPDLELQQATVRLHELGMVPHGRLPGFSGADAWLSHDGHQWHFRIESDHFQLDYPHLFRDTLHWSTLSAEGRLWREQGWKLELEPLTLLNPDHRLLGRLYLHWPQGRDRPFVDGQADLQQVNVASTWKYWPIRVFRPPLLRWLDDALLDGRARASFVIHGDLAHFPFRGQQGRFQFLVDAEDVQLRYHPQWPAGTVHQARLEFDRFGMHILQLEGEVAGMQINRSHGHIRDYRNALLELELEGQGTTGQALALLADSPVHAHYAEHEEDFRLEGEVRTRLRLRVPLSPRASQQHTTVDGRATLTDTSVILPAWQLRFDHVNGELSYDENGFSGQKLQTRVLNRFGEVDLCVAGHCTATDTVLQARLRGEFPMETIIRQAEVADALIPFMPGESRWDMQLTLSGNGQARLKAQTDLIGVRSLLPIPLHKPAAQPLPLRLTLALPVETGLFELQYGRLLRLRVLEPGKTNRAMVELGQVRSLQALDTLPAETLRVTGAVDELDLTGWLAVRRTLFDLPDPQARPWLERLDVQTDSLHILQHETGATRLQLWQQDGFWKARLHGERLQGEIQTSIHPGPDDTLIADFQRIHWPRLDTDKLEQVGEQARQHNIRVRDIPRLHLLAREFQLGDVALGEVRLEAYPIADGLRIERLQSRSDQLSVTASGDWLEDGRQTLSRFQIHLGIQSLGNLLANMGYANLIEGGQTVARFDVHWPGPPTAFALKKLGGTLELEVGPGQILELQPGAGRIFGLLSLQQLPRRLLLDFRDVFKRGLSFDKISGRFELDQGLARTDMLKMESNTARILISGQTDLVQQQYDQTIVVIPHVGQALPMVGALTGGVAGAAAMLAVQGLIGKALDESSGVVYRLTGPWADPLIQRLALQRNRPANGEPAAPAATEPNREQP